MTVVAVLIGWAVLAVCFLAFWHRLVTHDRRWRR